MAVFDVPASELIEAVAEDLKKRVEHPPWMDFVKTGRHRERAPHRRDWFFVRMASVLYRVYKHGVLGTNRLRTYYGGRKNRGVKPHRFFRASGKVIRVCLQELERLGFLEKANAGRKVSRQGESYLNKKAAEVKRALEGKAKSALKHEGKAKAVAYAKRAKAVQRKGAKARGKGNAEKEDQRDDGA